MATYGYIRTSRDQEPDRPGMNPETQRRDLIEAGAPESTPTPMSPVLPASRPGTPGGHWTPSWRLATSWWRHLTALGGGPWTSWTRSMIW